MPFSAFCGVYLLTDALGNVFALWDRFGFCLIKTSKILVHEKQETQTKCKRRICLFLLVFVCFFSSIFITNDVSLIIFVPFSILALKKES